MKRSTKIASAVLLTIGVVSGAAAYGKHKFGNHEARAAHMVEYITEELKLDTTQTQALEVLKDQMMSTAGILRAEVLPMRDELTALVSAETFDQARVLDLVNAKAAAMTAAAPEFVTALGSFLDGLDAEQKEQVLEFIQHRSSHRKGDSGRGWGNSEHGHGEEN